MINVLAHDGFNLRASATVVKRKDEATSLEAWRR